MSKSRFQHRLDDGVHDLSVDAVVESVVAGMLMGLPDEAIAAGMRLGGVVGVDADVVGLICDVWLDLEILCPSVGTDSTELPPPPEDPDVFGLRRDSERGGE